VHSPLDVADPVGKPRTLTDRAPLQRVLPMVPAPAANVALLVRAILIMGTEYLPELTGIYAADERYPVATPQDDRWHRINRV